MITDVAVLAKRANECLRRCFTEGYTDADITIRADRYGLIYWVMVEGHIGKGAKWEYENDEYAWNEGVFEFAEDFQEEADIDVEDDVGEVIEALIEDAVRNLQRQYEQR